MLNYYCKPFQSRILCYINSEEKYQFSMTGVYSGQKGVLMKYSYAFAAAILAGSMVAPAFAGVGDWDGGFKNDTTVYKKDVKEATATDKRDDTTTVSASRSGGALATGKIRIYDHDRRSWYTYTVGLTDPQSVRNQLRAYVSSYENGRGNISKIYEGSLSGSGDTSYHIYTYVDKNKDGKINWNSYWNGGAGEYYGDIKYSESTSYSGTTYTYETEAGDKHISYETKEDTKYDNTTTKTSERVEDGTIVVGSGDGLTRAFVGEGGISRDTEVTDHYTHTTTTVEVTTQDIVNYTTSHDVYQINATLIVCPIVLDLDGDGRVQASNGNTRPHNSFNGDNAVMFDFYGNGFPVATEWVGKTDGLLCRPDANGNVNGTNLFGTANGHNDGFEAMAGLDANKDGYLAEEELDGLYVWTDVNGNGHAEASELHSLDNLGITSISVNGKNHQGSFVRNGKEYKSFDWWPTIIECRKANMAQK